MQYLMFIGETMKKLWNMFASTESILPGVSWAGIRLGLILLAVMMSGLVSVIAIPKRREGDEIKRGRVDGN